MNDIQNMTFYEFISPVKKYIYIKIRGKRGNSNYFTLKFVVRKNIPFGNPSVIGGKKVQGYPVLRSRLRVQSEGKVPGGIG